MFAKWCQSTSCHGIGNLYEARTNKPFFLFWAIVTTSMICLCIFFSYATIKGYIESPYVTNIATISNTTLAFPEIMVCYNGGYNVTALKEANFSEDFIYALMTDAISAPNIRNISITDSEIEFLSYKNHQNISNRQFYTRFQFQCTDIIISSDETDLSCEHAETISNNDGACFALTNNGYQYRLAVGIYLELSSPNTSYASIYGNENNEIKNIKGPVTRDFLVQIEKTLDVSPVGRFYRIPINNRVDMIMYPKLYKKTYSTDRCEPNATRYPTSNSCYSRCDAELARGGCGCTLIQYDKLNVSNDMDVCPPFVVCDFLLEDLKKVFYDKKEKCSAKCLQKCDTWKYDPVLTFSPIDERVFKNRSHIHILYDNLQYQKVCSELVSKLFILKIN